MSSVVEENLGYQFKNSDLLTKALTHSSYANEALVESNERLEFLGDAVLGCAVAKYLFERYSNAAEGELSKLRSAIVSRRNFARLAKQLEIDKEMLLGKGEEITGGRERESNLSGAFEAVIGALYLEGGYRKTFSIISKLLKGCVKKKEIFRDYKTRLQELAQKEHGKIPRYNVVLEEGPPHDKLFHVEVKVGSNVIGKGRGKNKKEAEQAAAKVGFTEIEAWNSGS